MTPLDPAQRRALRARAHHLQPVVSIGQHGLTPAVLHEIDLNLLAHELIKLRIFNDDRAEREALLHRVCEALDALPVQHLGKILVIYRKAPAALEPADAALASPRRGHPAGQRPAARSHARASARQPAAPGHRARSPASVPGRASPKPSGARAGAGAPRRRTEGGGPKSPGGTGSMARRGRTPSAKLPGQAGAAERSRPAQARKAGSGDMAPGARRTPSRGHPAEPPSGLKRPPRLRRRRG